MSVCLQCGATLPPEEMTCQECGRLLAGTRSVVQVPLEEEAVLIHELLESAGFHPILARLDEGGQPRPITPGVAMTGAMGLLPPVTSPFAIYVPDDEAEEALAVLSDAGRLRINEESIVS